MGTLYVAVDFFYPGRFRPAQAGVNASAEKYDFEDGILYVVLQPAIDPNDFKLADYFGLQNAAGLAAHNIVFVTDKATSDAIAANGIPVPFPPETRLNLDLTWSDDSTPALAPRTLPTFRIAGQPVDPPYLLAKDDWPIFADANFALPPIAHYADLDSLNDPAPGGIKAGDAAKDAILSWAVALVPHILTRRDEAAHDPLTPMESAVLALIKPIADVLKPGSAMTDDAVRTALTTSAGGTVLVSQIWERALKPDAADKPHPILPPRFTHNRRSLTTDPIKYLHLQASGDPVPVAVSYHYKFWRDMQERVLTGAPDAVAEVPKMLGRYFGFGERLRWPAPVANDGFMVLDESPNRVKPDWANAIGSNGHSLLGQVFRIAYKPGAGLKAKSLIAGVETAHSIDLSQALDVLLNNVDNPPAPTFDIAMHRDADRPNGFFIFSPKLAQLTKFAPPQGSAFALPGSLLDAVDRSPRWTSPEAADDLLTVLPARLGLKGIDEIFRPELVGALAERRLIKKVGLARLPVASGKLFQLTLGQDVHSDETVEFTARFHRLQQADSPAELWVTPPGGSQSTAWPLKGRVLDIFDGPDLGPVAVLTDDQDGSLDKWLTPAAGPGNAADALHVDLNFGPSTAANDLFNLVVPAVAAAPPPLCILQESFTSRLSASTDRYLERFELGFSPSPAGTPPLLAQFANFNKMRVALTSQDPAVLVRAERAVDPGDPNKPYTVFLTYPDAAAPLDSANYTAALPPWKAAAPPATANRTYGYYVSHVFTQDMRGDGTASDADQNAAEALRYLNYLTPQAAWRLDGYAEHQYSYRIPVNGQTVDLPLTTDIQNPANAAAKDSTAPDAAISPLVQWSLDESAAPGKVVLSFPIAFLKLVKTPPGDADAANRPPRWRALYEPLADLMLAIDSDSATLTLERWVFDGPHHIVARAAQGAFAQSLKLASTLTRKVDKTLAGLDTIRALLKQPFSGFRAAVDLLIAAPDSWLTLEVPLDAQWQTAGAAPPLPLGANSEVLRLGLRLNRPAAAVVDPAVLPPSSQNAPGFGLEVANDDLLKTYPAIRGETFATLKAQAADELKDYIALVPAPGEQPSPLRSSFGWLRSQQPTLDPPAAPSPPYDAKRIDLLFGEMRPFVFIPQAPRPSVDRVLDLYYLPVAFRPIAGLTEFGDPAATLEFAEFAISLLDDLCAGRVPSSIDTALSASDAYRLAKTLQAGVLPDVVKQLLALLVTVHSENVATPADTPAAQRDGYEVLRYVDGLAGTLRPDYLAVLQTMLTQTPGLYASCKGFAVGIVDPATWSDKLHTLEMKKLVHRSVPFGETPPIGTPPPADRIDVERVPFGRIHPSAAGPRFFVDPLDDARYGDEFELLESTYNPPRQVWSGAAPGTVRRNTQTVRGAGAARTAGDVMRQDYGFDAQVGPGLRALEADAVHWNPNWRKTVPGAGEQRLYLLPSRTYPATPLVLKREIIVSSDLPPWRDELPLKLTSPQDKPDLDIKLGVDAAHHGLLQDILANAADGLSFSSGQAPLVARRLDHPLPAVAQPKNTNGWWHVESYASEHYFLVDTDEEAEDSPFFTDRFAIEVELHDSPPPNDSDNDPVPPKASQPLPAWFQYWRQVRAGKQPTQKPAALAAQDLELQLRRYLTSTGEANVLRPYTESRDASAQKTVLTYFKHGGDGTLVESVSVSPALSDDNPAKIGSVLAAEILQVDGASHYVLRVLVLDEPWRYTRVRVRIERNFTDVGGDAQPDVNTAFQMVGKNSAWSSHGAEPVTLDFSLLAKQNLPVTIWRMESGKSAGDFLNAGGTLKYDDPLRPVLAAQFQDTGGVVRSFWNLSQARDKFDIHAAILQRRPDTHPFYSDMDTKEQVDARTELFPRQFIASVPPPAPPAVAPEYPDWSVSAPNLHQIMEVTWSRDGKAVFAGRWPVRFST
jgi:hypothetical protein